MAFPMITFKVTNAEVSEELKDVIAQKLTSLEKYIQDASCICEVEFEKMTTQQSGDVFRVEVNLQIDGTLHRADATLGSFEQAIDEVRDELDKEMRRSRKKEDTLMRKGGRELKEMMREGGE